MTTENAEPTLEEKIQNLESEIESLELEETKGKAFLKDAESKLRQAEIKMELSEISGTDFKAILKQYNDAKAGTDGYRHAISIKQAAITILEKRITERDNLQAVEDAKKHDATRQHILDEYISALQELHSKSFAVHQWNKETGYLKENLKKRSQDFNLERISLSEEVIKIRGDLATGLTHLRDQFITSTLHNTVAKLLKEVGAEIKE